jgi:mono/diheme cytochrome c family protein
VRKRVWILIALCLACMTSVASADDLAEGRALYLQYCASCHGISGAGDGPLAGELTTPPTNLRLLYERFGNPLPEAQIVRYIDGRAEVRAHGPRDMPVWGRRFYYPAHGRQRVIRNAIMKLVIYLQSIQAGASRASLH